MQAYCADYDGWTRTPIEPGESLNQVLSTPLQTVLQPQFSEDTIFMLTPQKPAQ